jgi:hypothetical protein
MNTGIICGVVLLAALLAACSRRSATNDEIVVGGLYASKSEDGTFRVSKVLATDASAVHVRIYKNRFQSLPQNLDTSALSLGGLGDPDGFGVGHAPVAKEGWLNSKTFLKKEPVKDEELEGYKFYLEEMQKR